MTSRSLPNHQIDDHSRGGGLPRGACCDHRPAGWRDWSSLRARAGMICLDQVTVTTTSKTPRLGRSFGSGPLPRLRQSPAVRASAARLTPLHPRQCAAATMLPPVVRSQRISSLAAGNSGRVRVRHGLGRAFIWASAAFGRCCRLQSFATARYIGQDFTDQSRSHLKHSCVLFIQRVKNYPEVETRTWISPTRTRPSQTRAWTVHPRQGQ